MNLKNFFLIRFVVWLFHFIKPVFQTPTKLAGSFRTGHSSLKLERIPMNLQPSFQTRWVNLSFSTALAAQRVVRSPHSYHPNSGRWIKVLILCMVFSLLMIPAGGAWAASFVVNSTADLPDVNPGDGICSASGGVCTLRAAIMEANSSPGADTITLPAGVYALGIPTVNDDLDTTGDFDIHTPITILGAGADLAIVDGGNPLPGADPTARGMDRLIEIHPTAGNVTIKDVTFREGYTVDDGGGIQNWSPGLLLLERVKFIDNYAGGAGGGVNNADPAFL